MQKNKLNLHIYGIHLLNPYKTVVSHLKYAKFMALSLPSRRRTLYCFLASSSVLPSSLLKLPSNRWKRKLCDPYDCDYDCDAYGAPYDRAYDYDFRFTLGLTIPLRLPLRLRLRLRSSPLGPQINNRFALQAKHHIFFSFLIVVFKSTS